MPAPGAHQEVLVAQPVQHGEHHGQRGDRDRATYAVRGDGEEDAGVRARLDVDVVVSDAEPRDEPEPVRRPLKGRRADRGRQDDEGVVLGRYVRR